MGGYPLVRHVASRTASWARATYAGSVVVGMYSMRRFGSSDDPWFRVGSVDVSTTILVTALGVLSMVVWAIEGESGPIFRNLILISQNSVTGSVLDGQIWRLITWPIPNEPDFWTIVLLFVFFQLGTQVENLMGRKPFAWFLVALTLIPAIMVTLLEVVAGVTGIAAGLRFVELGVLIAFAMQYPKAPFFFGIPAWGITAAIVALEALQIVGLRDDYSLVMFFCLIVTTVVGFRSFGYAESLPQIPKVPLPASITGSVTTSRASRPPRRATRRRGRKNLRIVPPPSPAGDRLAEMEIDALLDQVASDGLDSLTKQQRKRLEDHSKELRRRREQG